MSEILSNDEVDMLLDAGQQDHATAEKKNHCLDVNPYDFIKAASKHFGNTEKIKTINELTVKSANELISHFLCRKVEVQHSEPEILPFKEFIASQEKPYMLNFIKIEGLAGTALLSFNNSLISHIIEILFGGDVKNSSDESRDYTHIDFCISALLSHVLCKAFSEAWHLLRPLKFEYVKSVGHPSLINFIDDQAHVMINRFRLVLTDQSNEFILCLPIKMLEPLREQLNHRQEESLSPEMLKAWHEQLERNVRSVPLPLTALLAQVSLSVKEIANLKVGDIISIDSPNTVEVFISNMRFFKAKSGNHQGKRAVQLQQRLDDCH